MMKNIKISRLKKGFTLVELMISMTLSSFVLASVTSTFIAFARGANSIGAYTEMSSQSRKTLEIFARDIRAAEEIASATGSSITITMPDNAFYSGQTIEFIYDNVFELVSRVEYDSGGTLISNDVLLDGVAAFTFTVYDPLGSELAFDTPSLLLSIKSIQMDSELFRKISSTDATDHIISARFMMRNRAVAL